jgi:hypothetical protein
MHLLGREFFLFLARTLHFRRRVSMSVFKRLVASSSAELPVSPFKAAATFMNFNN